MLTIETIAQAWGWNGLVAKSLVDQNSFGNVIVLDHDGRYWRICPEELSCVIIASNDGEYARIRSDPTFVRDWAMSRLHTEAREALGPTAEGRCYCLKIPAVLGGAYAPVNFGMIALDELISFSGHIAHQIKDLPDGARIEFSFVR
jgi:hypothetical protein